MGIFQSIYNDRRGPPCEVVKEEVFKLDEMIFEILVVFIVYILDRQLLNLYGPISSRRAYMGLHRLRKSSKIESNKVLQLSDVDMLLPPTGTEWLKPLGSEMFEWALRNAPMI